LYFRFLGLHPLQKFARSASGPNSGWEAPNALMVNAAKFDDQVIILRQLIADHQRNSIHSLATGLDPIDQVRRLGELCDQGLLTDEEFQTRKRQLLGL
jgi:hypothetical protein